MNVLETQLETGLKIEVHTTAEAFTQLESEWNVLLKQSPTDTVFLTWEWQSLWWDAYQTGDLLLVTMRDEGGTLVGIAPWFIEAGEGNERVVRGIGCVDVTDYVDMIYIPEFASRVFDAGAQVLRGHAARFTRINICNIHEGSATIAGLSQALRACGFEVEQTFQEVCPVIRLSGTFENYIEKLDKKNRHELRRKMRIAYGAPDLDWHIVTPDDDLDDATDKFLGLMAQSTQEKALFLENPYHVRFFRSVLPAMQRNGWLQLSFLTLAGEPTAAYVNFVYNGRVMVYNSGISVSHGHLSPGIVLLAYLIQHAAEQGYTEFDFLRGNEDYKYRMGGVDETLYMLKAVLPK